MCMLISAVLKEVKPPTIIKKIQHDLAIYLHNDANISPDLCYKQTLFLAFEVNFEISFEDLSGIRVLA